MEKLQNNRMQKMWSSKQTEAKMAEQRIQKRVTTKVRHEFFYKSLYKPVVEPGIPFWWDGGGCVRFWVCFKWSKKE